MNSMQRRWLVCLAVTAAISLAGDIASADEGFFSRINPWRKPAAQTAASTATHAAAAAPPTTAPKTTASTAPSQGFSISKLGQIFKRPAATDSSESTAPAPFDTAAIEASMAQMTSAGAQKLDQSLPSVEQLRSSMQAQGYDTAAIEAGIAELASAGAKNVQQRLPSIDEVRAKMQAQGYDTAAIEARIAQLAAAGQLGLQAVQTYGGQLPSIDQVRSQMQAQGYDRAAIEAKVAELAAAGAQQLTQRLPSAAEVRSQMQAQGYDTAAIETRVAQLAAAGQLAVQTYQSIGQPTGAIVPDPGDVAETQNTLPVTSEPAPASGSGSAISQVFNWWNKK